MIESEFTRAVHKHLPPDIWAWKICDEYMGGIPDAYYRSKVTGKALWIEYKYLQKLPVKDSTLIVPALSGLQKKLLQETVDCGQQAMVIVGFKSAGAIYTSPDEWLNGLPKHEFERRLKSYKQLVEAIKAVL
jgi:hypothetical protein